MQGWNYLYWPLRDASVSAEGRQSGLLVLFVCSKCSPTDIALQLQKIQNIIYKIQNTKLSPTNIALQLQKIKNTHFSSTLLCNCKSKVKQGESISSFLHTNTNTNTERETGSIAKIK